MKTRIVPTLVLLLLAACNFPGSPQAAQQFEVETALAQTLSAAGIIATETQAPPTPLPTILPHPVYFLSYRSGSAQVWRLEADGVTLSQVTDETDGVDSFDASRVDGRVAFVTNNQLYIANSGGGVRTLLVDNSAANTEAVDFYYRQRISSPRFSPDGRFLAYAFDGLWILDLTTNESVHLINNEIGEGDEGNPILEKFFGPQLWAPDSAKVLLEIGYQEAGTLAILNPNADPLVTEFESSGIVCCQAAWASDSGSILVASPYIGLVDSGLWRYDAQTGEESTLIGSGSELYEFAGWPLELANGDLQYFYTSSPNIPDGDVALYMVRSAADGVNGRVQLRADAFVIREALWAEDGSLALIVQATTASQSGPVVLARSDGTQLQVLLDEGRDLRWGN
jgi:WD40 repeat protein